MPRPSLLLSSVVALPAQEPGSSTRWKMHNLWLGSSSHNTHTHTQKVMLQVVFKSPPSSKATLRIPCLNIQKQINDGWRNHIALLCIHLYTYTLHILLVYRSFNASVQNGSRTKTRIFFPKVLGRTKEGWPHLNPHVMYDLWRTNFSSFFQILDLHQSSSSWWKQASPVAPNWAASCLERPSKLPHLDAFGHDVMLSWIFIFQYSIPQNPKLLSKRISQFAPSLNHIA